MKLDIFEKSQFSRSDIKFLNDLGLKILEKLSELELENKFWELQDKINTINEDNNIVSLMTFMQNKILELQKDNGFKTSI